MDLRAAGVSLPSLRAGTSVSWAGDSFSVGEMIGEGGFARVFGAVWDNGPLEERDTVLKIQSPANDWEWYILNQVNTIVKFWAQSGAQGVFISVRR